MQMVQLGRLNARIVTLPDSARAQGAGTSAPPLVVVLAHGFGAPGNDLAGLADALELPPGSVLVFPEALHSLRKLVGPLSGDGRAWWMIDMAALERAIARKESRNLRGEVPEGLAEARAAYEEMLEQLAAIVPLDRLVLGGFSQGAMLSLDVALRNPARKLAGIVLLSGTFLAEHEWRPLMAGRKATPVFQSHGDADPILPVSLAELLRDGLREAGVEVTYDAFGGAHTIPPRTLDRLGGWLRALP